MLNKYIVTLETPEGLEIICRPRDGPFISSFSHSEAESWANIKAQEFPGYRYNVYKLEFVVSTSYEETVNANHTR